MSFGDSLHAKLQSNVLGTQLWVVLAVCVGVLIVFILALLLCMTCRRKSRRRADNLFLSQIPNVSKEIGIDRVGAHGYHNHPESTFLTVNDRSNVKPSEKLLVHLGTGKSSDPENPSQCSSVHNHERGFSSQSGEDGSSGTGLKLSASPYAAAPVTASPLVGLPEFSHLGWGHWFTLRDLQLATNNFATQNVLGEGGYGVVYQGRLVNGTEVAVKKLLNNLGQAEKEFRVEVEAIGHVRHKNLVRLLGYCIEGVHRMLVYEYVNNGNLEEWLHGSIRSDGGLPWDARMKVALGTAKALAYLHEAIEPKVVHRDIKSSNILMDTEFNAKVSDFGLAKLLDSGESHITTRVMGTFGYVAPEYANTGMLNEKSDVYSFGVLLLEVITGRDPVDYSRPTDEVNLVEWLKVMVGTRRIEEVVDPKLETKPTTRALKRSLLVALRCVDPESAKRPKMTQVVRMLEADEYPLREERRTRKSRTTSTEIELVKEDSGLVDTGTAVDDLARHERSEITQTGEQ
ncbi:hypothetical protein MLD38_003145 [Melastoma candidum]|uniref:Uncharacterized protein n=1 Tax=Melastoma candidum TaxID=119954 RepID=A0ACB9S635_9MYRT|nr:hypothetical protein MLD38_003145 [Melastoma candidum]